MNPKSAITSFSFCMLLSAFSYAQSSLDKEGKSSSKGDTEKRKMNIVKVNILPALFIKNFSFQYERIVSKHFSIALGSGFMPNSGIPYKDRLISIADITDPDAINSINNFKMSSFSITPEVRFYLGKKGYGRGFYIAPYYRFSSFKSDELPVDYTNSNDQSSTMLLKGDIKTNNGGLLFGSQWFLGKAITLDWWILGVHYGTNKGLFTGTSSTPLTLEEQDNIKQTLDDISLPVGTITSTVNANGATVNLSGPWAGIRGGLTLGFRF
ncbi:MAG: DUF3575 domain-containing protein [Chitinophagaceae bacterium]|nr:DUF3575 domain-containing protein [Chitinophagaceae bacterium]